MRHVALTLAVLVGCFTLVSCSGSEEDKVEDVVDELVDALNAHDAAKASSFYMDGEFPAVSAMGDSSVIYRMMQMSYAEDFDVDDLRVAVIDQQAQASFYLSGDVSRGDSLAGRMSVRLKLDLTNLSGSWKIIPGSEARDSGS